MNKKCNFHDKGICMRKQKCSFFHPTEICNDDGIHESYHCQRRHPKLCIFYLQDNKRKFNDSCLFRHVKTKYVEERNLCEDQIKEFKEKLEEKDCLLMHKNDLVGKFQSENSANKNSMKVSFAEKDSL